MAQRYDVSLKSLFQREGDGIIRRLLFGGKVIEFLATEQPQKRNPGRKANEESNMGIVPMKPPNGSHEGVTGDVVEGRPVTKENIMGQAPTQLSVGLVYGVPKRLA